MLFLTAAPLSAATMGDSLEVRLILVDDHKKLELHNQLAGQYLRNHPDKALKHARQALLFARQYGNASAKAEALRHIGLSFKRLTGDFDSATYYCLEALKIAETLQSAEALIEAYMALSVIYREVGNNLKALEYLEEAELLADRHGLASRRGDVLNDKAILYTNLNQPAQVQEALRHALKLAKTENDRRLLARTNNSLGAFYRLRYQPEMSVEHHRQALSYFIEQNDATGKADALYLLGEAYRTKNDTAKALLYHEQALEIERKLNDMTGMATSLHKIAALYFELADYDKATLQLQESLKYAWQLGDKHLMREAFDLLYYVHLRQEHFKEASDYKDQYAAISALIYGEESDRRIAQMQTQYEIEKREQEIDFLEQKNAFQSAQLSRRRIFNVVLGAGTFIFLCFALFVWRSYLQKKKTNKKLEALNARVLEQNEQLKELVSTKDKFFSIIGHDLKGPLNSLMSFSGLLINHTSRLSADEIKMVATDLEKSVKNLHSLLENLLTWSRAQTGRLELKPEIFDLYQVIAENAHLLSASAEKKKITVDVAMEEGQMTHADRNTVSTVVRNLLSNAIKFTREKGTITIYSQTTDDMVEIAVRDTGVGMSQDVRQKLFDISVKHSTLGTHREKGTGLGLVLCREFVEKNGGRLEVESEEGLGSVFRFTLPMATAPVLGLHVHNHQTPTF